MNRKYTREEYLAKCDLIYKMFPDAAITTDIIAGFCGETEEDFLDSLSIIEEAKLSRVHAFAFSPREGTRAFDMQDVPKDIKSQRLHRLLEGAENAARRYISERLGQVYSVIFEDFNGEYTTGYTEGYIKVYVKGNNSGRAAVKLKSFYLDGAEGEIVD